LAALQAGTLAIPTLPSGGSVTFTLTGTAGTSGTITNVATVSTPPGTTDPTPGNNTSTANTTITPIADLQIVKSGTTTVNANGSVTYTLVVTNNGPSAANGATVGDASVANFTATGLVCASATGGAVCPASPTVATLQAGTLAIPTLPSGSSITFTLTGTAGTSGSITNVATVSVPPGTTDPTPNNNTSTANTTITPIADLQIVKSGTPTVNANGSVTYTLIITNNGPSAANGATVSDPVVANFAANGLTCSATGGAICPASPTLSALQAGTLAIPTLPSGGSVTFTLTGTAGTSGTITNVATVSTPPGTTDPNSNNNTSTTTTTITPVADLQIVKSGTATVNANGSITYSLVVTNNGPSAANGATVGDPAVANFTATGLTCSATGGAICPTNPTLATLQAGTLAIPTLPSGGSVTFTLTGTAGTSGTITNVATVSTPPGTTDPTPNNNTSTTTTTINPIADLAVVKTGTATVNAGGTVTYSLVITNNGPSAANGATVSDPAVANFTAASLTCSGLGGAICPANLTLAALQAGTLAIPTLPSGGSLTLTLTGTAGPNGGTIVNNVNVSTPPGTTDPTPNNNTSTTTTTITPASDLSIVKTGSTNVNAGGSVSYNLVITNNGPSAANGATVSDPAVANFTATSVFCSSSSGGAACPVSPTVATLQAGTLAIPTLPSGGSITLTLTGTAGGGGIITNIATITPPVGTIDPTPNNNTSTASTNITPQSDLQIVKTGPPTFASNGSVSYTLVITNNGPSAANNATVSDPAVANFTASGVTCGTATGGAVCPASPTLAALQAGTLAIPTLPSGGSVTLTLTGTAGTGSTITNVATVTPPAGVIDPTLGNNTSTVITGGSSTDLAVVKTGPITVNANGSVTYTIIITNNGPLAANNTTVSDPSVVNFTATTLTCGTATGGAVCPVSPTIAALQSGTLTIPTLPSGGSLVLTLTGTAGTTGTIANTVTVTPPAGVTDPSPGNNVSTANTTINPVADLQIIKTGPATFTPGGSVTYTLVITNNGPSAANGATVSDPVVANFTAAILTCGTATGGAVCPTNPTLAALQAGTLAIPTLPSGGSLTLTLTGTAGTGSTITNVASVVAPSGVTDPVPSNNTSTSSSGITAPDLTPIITALPATQYGTSNFTVVVDVFELLNVSTSGAVTLYVSKSPLINLTFNSSATVIGGKSVQNNGWTFDGTSDPDYYILTTNRVINASGRLSFGLNGVLTPGSTSGVIPITTIIFPGSGGEINPVNNTDPDSITFFQQ
jgi:uncharacterized repeat protein (TIGR01451 family)